MPTDLSIDLPLIDHHCHGVSPAELDFAAFQALFSESYRPAPPGTTEFQKPLGLAIRRFCAPMLDLEPSCPAEVYVERRLALGAAEVNRRFLHDGLRLVRAQAEAGGVALHLSPLPAIALKGDERRLRQCVVNLLANAIKFAPRGAVTVSAEVTGAAGIEIRIADTGCGIPLDQLEQVFQPFHQVENELSRTTNGTGLGLPLSRKLVERHGGTLHLESIPGRGTTAILSLPGRAVPLDGLWAAAVSS